MKNNMVGWFEIPVTNMERAIAFYEKVFDLKLDRHQMGPLDMAWFPWDEQSPGSAGSLICQPEHYKPSQDGVTIYFNSQAGDLKIELSRVETAGGKVLLEKRLITEEIGYMGLFTDSEGNRVALHSRE